VEYADTKRFDASVAAMSHKTQDCEGHARRPGKSEAKFIRDTVGNAEPALGHDAGETVGIGLVHVQPRRTQPRATARAKGRNSRTARRGWQGRGPTRQAMTRNAHQRQRSRSARRGTSPARRTPTRPWSRARFDWQRLGEDKGARSVSSGRRGGKGQAAGR